VKQSKTSGKGMEKRESRHKNPKRRILF